MCAVYRRLQHALHDVIRLIDRGAFTVENQVAAFDAQGDRKSVFECREILIELSKEAKVIAQGAQVDGSFGC